MKPKGRFAVAVGVLGLLITAPAALTGILLFADAKEAERAALAELLLPHLPAAILILACAYAVGIALLRGQFVLYVHGVLRMADTMRLMLGANRNLVAEADGPPELAELARAANDLARQRNEVLNDVDARIGRAKATLEEEKNRLAALMSELALGVVVCNLDGRILLYNSRARLQFKALSQGPTSMSGGALIGLGRSIFSILDRGQIDHSLDNIRRRMKQGTAEPSANFITTARGGQLLRAQMAPVLAAAEGGVTAVSGYVLTIENITRNFEREAERDQVLHSLTDGSRAALGNIRAAAEMLNDSPDMEPAYRERFARVIAEEAAGMSQRLESTMNRYADSLKTRWPLEDVRGIDILAAASSRIADRLALVVTDEDQDDGLWVRADSFALIQALTFLASRLKEDYAIREVRMRLCREGKLAFVDLIWSGTSISSETLYAWELEPMTVGPETIPLTLRDIINRHGGEVWYQREKVAHRAFFRLVLPVAEAPEAAGQSPPATRGSRPEYYDFDLFAALDSAADLDRKLTELAYSVFDTETTGLEPSGGDEIIQIGAVRIVNNRLLRQEIFDQIVDPRIPLKAAGIPIHGITEDMLRGQPMLEAVLPAFHEFCAETVLVAHNAAFDLRFLQVKEDVIGIRFDQPVLDTLLLSAVIHPNQESHQLENIAERLGVQVMGRHTALGDALVTGEIFLKMLPLLAEQGIHTLRQALDAAQRTYYARIKY